MEDEYLDLEKSLVDNFRGLILINEAKLNSDDKKYPFSKKQMDLIMHPISRDEHILKIIPIEVE